jgi:methionine aminotransferase
MTIHSKLPDVGTSIFTVMSALAQQHGAVNLAQGFPNYDCSDTLKDLVRQYMSTGFNQYAPMAGVPALRARLADKIKILYGKTISIENEITVTAGGTQGIYTTIAAFVRPHDEVIIIEPAYDSYAPSIQSVGGKVVSYKMSLPDYQVDWVHFQSLITPKTRMIIINTPHNPTGTTFKDADFQALIHCVKNTNILILSDEVYEHLVYDGAKHLSILDYPALWMRGLAVYSFGKTFHATGWKMGYCVAPEGLMREFRKLHQFNVFSVNAPIQYALADFLEDEANYIHLNAFYQQKRDFFAEKMQKTAFKPLNCNGTYFQLYDYSAISNESDIDFTRRLTIDYGVAAIPVSAFCTGGSNARVIRFCFAKTEDVLAKACALLEKI